MIERLVAFDTTSRESNLALIEFVRDYLADLGVGSLLVPDPDGRKANLYATLGPDDRPGIMLSGHTDVVPVDGQAWDSDPFRVVERDGRLYGRGTADMKSFIAIVLARAPAFLRRGLATPIHLALSYDEEVGCIGVRRLIARFAELPLKPTACIVGEPTGMRVVTAHKGKRSWRCRVRGLECHSALTHLGVNAVEAAAELVARLKALARERRDRGPHDAAFDPPYSTVHTGTIQGGTALNIVPKECWFDCEVRHLPHDDPGAILDTVQAYAIEAVLPEMHAVSAATGIDWEELSSFVGLDTPQDSDTHTVSFGTEAGLFSEAAIPTVVCGPGSIVQAHKPNEFIELEQVVMCEAFLDRLMDRVCAP
jgi:acetylornithine deacetylase